MAPAVQTALRAFGQVFPGFPNSRNMPCLDGRHPLTLQGLGMGVGEEAQAQQGRERSESMKDKFSEL
eukprot:3105493-Alexandrium_andersonii.AAC.1